MREQFPDRQVGQRLQARHLNRISRVCRRVSADSTGSYSYGHSGSFNAQASASPQLVEQIYILSQQTPLADKLYTAVVRYWDDNASEWTHDVEDNETGQYLLDGTEHDGFYEIGQIVSAYWHPQRGAFVPVVTPKSSKVLLIGKAVAEIEPDATGQIRLWKNGEEVSGDEGLLTVSHDWITQDLAIEKDSEVIAGWFADENLWRIIGAECPTV